MSEKKKALKAAFPHTIPVLTGYLFIGIAFGVLLQDKGYHFGWAILMSACIFAGSMQFVAIGLLTGGFNLLNAIVMTLMVNARHIFYGLAMLDKFKGMGRKKPYMIFSLTDETFSLLCSAKPPDGVHEKWFQFFIALLDQLYWIAGSALGGLLGAALHFNTKGIDFVMTALFVVIFLDQWKAADSHLPALVGVFGSALCLILFGPQNFIIPSMILIVLILTVFRRPMEKEERP